MILRQREHQRSVERSRDGIAMEEGVAMVIVIEEGATLVVVVEGGITAQKSMFSVADRSAKDTAAATASHALVA